MDLVADTRKARSSYSFFFLILVSVVFFGIFGVKSKIFEANRRDLSSCAVGNLLGNYDSSAKIAHFEGQEVVIPDLLGQVNSERLGEVLGSSSGERWIEIDLSDQKLRAWEASSLFVETAVSTGLPGTPTPKGEFRIWTKLRFTKMEGGEGRDYYYLPNVPFVMFFEGSGIPNWKGYGLHGTYWHNDFGNRRSHGCVNLPTTIAEKIYYWVTPQLFEGKNSVRATDDNPGTRIVIHE